MNSSRSAGRDEDAPVTVASFPTAFEADLARLALASQGMTARVENDHGQYVSAAPWVRLQVPRSDRDRAISILEEGPPGGTKVEDAEDDLRPLRLRRRFVVARWFLYSSAATLFIAGGGVLLPLFVVPLGLAVWSRTQPRYAFGVAMGVQAVVTFGSVATLGLAGLPLVIPLIAFQFAWMSASPRYMDQMQESSLPETPSVSIGDAWKTGGATREPAERQPWWIRSVTVLIAILTFACFFYLAFKI